MFDEAKQITKRSTVENLGRMDEILSDETLTDDEVKEVKTLFWALNNIKTADSKKLNQAIFILKSLQSEGKGFIDAHKKKETKRIDGLQNVVIDETIGGRDNLLEEEQITFKEQEQGTFKRIAKAVDEFAFTRNDALETLLDNIRVGGERYEGAMHEAFTQGAFDAGQNFHTKNANDFAELGDSIFDSFKEEGKSPKDSWNTLKDFNVKKANSGIFYKPSGKAKIEVPLSQWEAVQMWMWKQDESLAPSFDEMGWTETTTSQVETFIGPSGIAAGKKMLDTYSRIGNEVNDVLFDVEGYRMPLIENYSPVQKKFKDKEADLDEALDINDLIPATEKNRSFKERTKNKAVLRPTAAHRNFEKHISDMNHYMAYARVAKDMRNTFGARDVKNAIRQSTGGTVANKLLRDQMDDIIRGRVAADKVDKFINPIIRNLAVSKLAFNLPSALKQLGSIPAYADSMPAGEWAKRFGNFFGDVKGNSEVLLNTEYMVNRLATSHDRDLREVAKRDITRELAGLRNYRDRMMVLTRMGDAGAIVAGGYPVYSYHRDQALKAGKPQEEAEAFGIKKFVNATRRAQQSSEIMDLGLWQRGGGFAKLFTMYQTSPIQYNRAIVNAIKAHSSKGFVKGLKGEGRITNKQLVKTVFIYHVLLPQIFTAMGSLGVGAFSDDEEKSERFWKRQLTALFVGNLNSVFIAGDAYEAVVKTLAEDEESFIKNLSIPILDQLKDFVKAADDIEEEEYVSAADNLMSGIMSFAGLPYDPVKKALDGMWDSAFGETDHPVLRFMGYSDYILMEKDKDTRTKARSRRRSFKSL